MSAMVTVALFGLTLAALTTFVSKTSKNSSDQYVQIASSSLGDQVAAALANPQTCHWMLAGEVFSNRANVNLKNQIEVGKNPYGDSKMEVAESTFSDVQQIKKGDALYSGILNLRVRSAASKQIFKTHRFVVYAHVDSKSRIARCSGGVQENLKSFCESTKAKWNDSLNFCDICPMFSTTRSNKGECRENSAAVDDTVKSVPIDSKTSF